MVAYTGRVLIANLSPLFTHLMYYADIPTGILGKYDFNHLNELINTVATRISMPDLIDHTLSETTTSLNNYSSLQHIHTALNEVKPNIRDIYLGSWFIRAHTSQFYHIQDLPVINVKSPVKHFLMSDGRYKICNLKP